MAKGLRMLGRKWNIWDLLLIVIIIGSGWYLYSTLGLEGILENFALFIFSFAVFGFLLNWIIRKAKK